MKKYYVIWTYIGNYSDVKEVDAESASEAAQKVTWTFSADFQKKAHVYVFDREPAFHQGPAQKG